MGFRAAIGFVLSFSLLVLAGAHWAKAAGGAAENGVDILQRSKKMQSDDPQLLQQQLYQSMARAADEPQARIVGGQPVLPGFFRDAVAILRDDALCTGVLISSSAALTAAHCYCDMHLGDISGGGNRSDPYLYIADGTPSPIPARSIPTSKKIWILSAVLYDPDYCRKRDSLGEGRAGADVALLNFEPPTSRFTILQPGPDTAHVQHDDEVAPARILPTYVYLTKLVRYLSIVGFGRSEYGVGQKRHAIVRIVSRICGTAAARSYFGCNAGTEAVLAGDFGQDTCEGDSGGPAYAALGNEYYLAALTSRAIDPNGKCGAGGVYTLITPAIVHWIRKRGVQLYAQQ